MKKKTDDIIQTISRVYASEESLKSLKAIKDAQGNTLVDAVISLVGQETRCHLQLDTDDRILSKQCECNWFKDYGHCPHLDCVYATLISQDVEYPIDFENVLINDIEDSLQSFDKRVKQRKLKENAFHSKPLLDQFINMYTTQLKLSIDHTQYEIEPIFSDKYAEWELSFKVGNEKKYVVKSITEFLNSIDNKREVSYGKSLRFIHSEDMFTKASLQSIQFMRRYGIKPITRYGEQNIKSIHLEGKALDDFFDLYEDSSDEVSFVLETTTEKELMVEITSQDEYYIFHCDLTKEYHFGEKHIYQKEELDKSTLIYRNVLDEQGITLLFLKQLLKEDIVIDKEDYAKFYQYVLMIAMQYINITLPTQVDDEQMERAELYGDIDEDNRIYFYMYCYNANNIRYYGFDKERVISYEQVQIETYIKKYADEIDEQKHFVYMDENNEKTLDFIMEGLPFLSGFCQIYVSDALKSLGKSHQYNIQVGVKFKNDLLSLEIESDDIPKDELAAILASYKKRKKFYRLKNGKLLSLQSNDLEQLDSFLDEYHIGHQDLAKKSISLEPYRMFALDESIKNQDSLHIHREKSFATYMQSYYEPKSHKIPKHYETILRDYQKDGFQWLSIMRQYKFNGILADDMGLGKTLQVIALLEANKGMCSIVVCPASLLYNWEEEVHKFTNNLAVLCITGTQEERKEKILKYKDVDVLITSYDYLRRDIEYYDTIQFDTVILDEAQYIKNQKTKNAVSAKQLNAMHKLALTGTPIENSLAELWSIFDFLMPNYLFNYHYFQKRFENDIVKDRDEEKQKALQKLVSPFILRRNKKDVLKELPDKIETVRMIEFTNEENKLYRANVAQITDQLATMDDSKNNKIMILAMLTKLRQLCCEPRLLYENVNQVSSKLMDCMELIEEFHQNQKKVLLFSAFTSILDLIADELRSKHISFYQLTGKVSKENRKDLVTRFQSDDTCVFLISLKAGGTGLNLTAAEAVIHYDPWWNQSAQSQATDRAYRIGQNKNVQVFKMIMKDSIEENILKLQEQKKELADAFVENNEGSITSMNKDEIMQLFKNEPL